SIRGAPAASCGGTLTVRPGRRGKNPPPGEPAPPGPGFGPLGGARGAPGPLSSPARPRAARAKGRTTRPPYRVVDKTKVRARGGGGGGVGGGGVWPACGGSSLAGFSLNSPNPPFPPSSEPKPIPPPPPPPPPKTKPPRRALSAGGAELLCPSRVGVRLLRKH